MPLLQGKLDPLRFNSTELAIATYSAERQAFLALHISNGLETEPWERLDESTQMAYVDVAQAVIDRFLAEGIIT